MSHPNFDIQTAPARLSRIAFTGFRSGPGGIPNVLVNLMNGLAAADTPIDLLVNGRDIPELDRLRRDIRVIDLSRRSGLTVTLRLAGYLSNERPSALLSTRERAGRQALYARRLTRSAVRILVRVGTHNSVSLQQRNLVQRFLRRRALAFTYRRVDGIIAVSRGVAADLAAASGLPPERIVTLNNPTVPEDVRERAAVAVAHPWLQPGAPPVIMALGRLARVKDYPTLLQAFARLRATAPLRLMILGDGNQRGALLDLAAHLGVTADVALPGFVANPYSYLSKATLFVLCSRREGSPNALIEALAVGTPVVATDCPSGPGEILDHGRIGRLVSVGDVEGLAGAMKATLDRPPDPDRLRDAVRPFGMAAGIEAYRRVLWPEAARLTENR